METKSRLNPDFLLRCALVFALLLPVLLLRGVTPDNELKYLQIADEALRDGHFWCLYHNGALYADKPPLYLWIVMLFRQLTGHHCLFLLEMFSLIPAFVTLGVMERWAGEELRGRFRIAAFFTLMTCAYILGGAVVLRMDMLMTMFITLALWTFWRMYKGDDSLRLKILFPLYVFMAIFSKGPVGIMIPLLCIPIYLLCVGRIGFLKKVWGWRSWVILVALCAVWWTFVYLEGGSEYLNNLLFHQTAGRAVNAFHHKQPMYYYCYTIWYANGPWSLLYAGILVAAAVRRTKMPELPAFWLNVAASFFVIMSLVSGKLAIYLLPVFPFISYACLALLQRMSEDNAYESGRRQASCRRWASVAIFGSLAMLLAGLVIGLFFTDWMNSLLV